MIISKPRRAGKSGAIPVHKLDEDARPLSAEEYRMYSQVGHSMREATSADYYVRPPILRPSDLTANSKNAYFSSEFLLDAQNLLKFCLIPPIF